LILLKKFKKYIPSFRHKTDIKIYDNSFDKLKHKIWHTKIFTKNFIKRKKVLYSNFLYNIHLTSSSILTLLTKKFVYKMKPYKKIIVCETLEGISYNLPGIENVNPGKIMYPFNKFKYVYKVFFLTGFLIFLYKLPINSICSNVTNLLNSKITYSKSSGTYCKFRKNKKSKKKLLLIVLPSTQEMFLTKTAKVYVGKNQNFKTNELVEGKWGSGFSLKKKINVRGVAMNPVDHPNGGRAKTVQPERSPWNWVAKKKK